MSLFLFNCTGKPARDETHPDFAPTLHLGHEEVRSSSQLCQDRYTRKKQRESRQVERSAAEALISLGEETCSASEPEPEPEESSPDPIFHIHIHGYPPCPCMEKSYVDSSAQTDVSGADLDVLHAQAQQFRMEQQRKEEVNNASHQFSQQSLKDNDKKVKFYTGLPTFAVLMVLFNFLKEKIRNRTSMTAFQQLIVVLVKLRLAVPNEDLAYRFNCHESTISRIVNDMIDIMYSNLGGLVRWPDRESLRKTMPMQFRRTFGKKVAIVIDCFEVFCRRPTSLEARAQTWSNYKHHNTVKFLIGITPCGVISYLSSAWGGRGTDKTITIESDFFSKLLPGDIVLADRGFNIKDDAGIYGCDVQIPAFTRGKPQLSALDVEKTREIAHLRIHVERVIGCVRQKYTILDKTVPIDYLVTSEQCPIPKIDKVAKICCGLTNMSESLIASS